MKAGLAIPKARIQPCSAASSSSSTSHRHQPRRCVSYSARPSRATQPTRKYSGFTLQRKINSLGSTSSSLGLHRLYSRAADPINTSSSNGPDQSFFYSHQSINQAEAEGLLAGIKGDESVESLDSTTEESFLKQLDEVSLLARVSFKTNPAHQSVDRKYVSRLLEIKNIANARAKKNSGVAQSFKGIDLSSWGKKKNATSTASKSDLQEEFAVSADKVKQFANSTREITEHDVATFLQIHAQDSGLAFIAYLEELILTSNEHTLPAIAQFISSHIFKQSSFSEFLPQDQAVQEEVVQNQVSLVLVRALEVFPSTTVSVESGEVDEIAGVASLASIKQLLDQFSEHSDAPSLKDLYARLVSKSCTYESAKEIISTYTEEGLSFTEETVDAFIESLSRYSHAKWETSSCTLKEFSSTLKEEIIAYRPFFVSETVTPAITNFLLDFVVDPHEFYGILDIVEESRYQDRILSECQPNILKAAVRCHMGSLRERDPANANSVVFVSPDQRGAGPNTVAMSHMFGLLTRFDKTSSGITKEALEECLVLSARLGNTAAMYQALALRLHLTQGESTDASSVPISKKILSQVFNAFPISSGAVAHEKKTSFSPWIVSEAVIIDSARDESVLFHLRSQLHPLQDTKVYSQYLLALGRCSRSDLILYEWEQLAPLISENVNDSHFQDVVMALLSAFKTAGSMHGGRVLEALLEASTLNTANHGYALNVLTKVLNRELLPLAPTLHVVTKWLLDHPKAGQWTDADVTKLYYEVSPESVHMPELLGTASDSLSQLQLAPDEGKPAHLVLSKVLSNLVNQVRNGQDAKLAFSHVENLFGKYA